MADEPKKSRPGNCRACGRWPGNDVDTECVSCGPLLARIAEIEARHVREWTDSIKDREEKRDEEARMREAQERRAEKAEARVAELERGITEQVAGLERNVVLFIEIDGPVISPPIKAHLARRLRGILGERSTPSVGQHQEETCPNESSPGDASLETINGSTSSSVRSKPINVHTAKSREPTTEARGSDQRPSEAVCTCGHVRPLHDPKDGMCSRYDGEHICPCIAYDEAPAVRSNEALYVTIKGERHHFWRDEAERAMLALSDALNTHDLNKTQSNQTANHTRSLAKDARTVGRQRRELRTLHRNLEREIARRVEVEKALRAIASGPESNHGKALAESVIYDRRVTEAAKAYVYNPDDVRLRRLRNTVRSLVRGLNEHNALEATAAEQREACADYPSADRDDLLDLVAICDAQPAEVRGGSVGVTLSAHTHARVVAALKAVLAAPRSDSAKGGAE